MNNVTQRAVNMCVNENSEQNPKSAKDTREDEQKRDSAQGQGKVSISELYRRAEA